MISRSVRLLEARSTIFPDRQQAIGEATVSFSAYPIQALTNRFRDCRSHGLAGESRQFFHEPMRFFVFDVEAHDLYQSTISILKSTMPLPFEARRRGTIGQLLLPVAGGNGSPACKHSSTP
jgi:hypothetical protein